MDDQQQARWRPTRRHLLWAGGIAVGALFIVVVCGYLFGWKWTGLAKRTLWDWLDLLIIPAVLAGGGLWFNAQQKEREQQIANEKAQDEALEAYLGQMSQLLTDEKRPLLRAQPGDNLSAVARARTLSVLPRLGGNRKRSVVEFLYESGLLYKDRIVFPITGADLSGAYLPGRLLEKANLIDARLQRAYLVGARLREADLLFAKLMEANLEGANLSGASLFRAMLQGANLHGADLTGATGITNEELEQQAASLDGATMPDGQQYEDWLKSRGKGDSATPEQEGGPWWGGPYHRRGIWRRLFGA